MITTKKKLSKIKKTGIKTIGILFLMLIIGSISSCEKDAGKDPNISFKYGGNYTSADATVSKNTSVLIGIDAAKAEKKDVLKTFDASKSYDGGAENSFESLSLSGSDQDAYSYETTITTRNQAGTEKYLFTVINRDGLKSTISLTLTVN